MTEFWLGALLLLALAALFVLFPRLFLRQRQVADQEQSNRDWYVQRSEELQAQATEAGVDVEDLIRDAQLRMLENGSAEASAAAADASQRSPLQGVALLLALALPAAALYSQLGAGPDVLLTRDLGQLGQDSSESDYRRLMLQVEDRASQRPDNLHYQAMLGRFYMNEGDYSRARDLYVSFSEQAPNDSTALALAAQASFLAADRQLDSNSQMLAERALSIDPHQRTALGLLGMVSYEKGQYQAAISYWQRLLVMEDPNSPSGEMIRGVIARAEAALSGAGPDAVADAGAAADPHAGVAGAVAAPAETTESAASGAGVTLRLQLGEGTSAAPGDTVFVFARNPAVDSRMPVAVKRLTAAQLPLTLRLDDASSMAGQKISELAEVEVVARVSPSGRPGEQHATLQAVLSALVPDSSSEVHALVLQPPS